MGIGAILLVIGIVLLVVGHPLWGILLIVLGLLLGGFRRGRWY
jgi:hypothetical protein